jgi:hypothetical protein
MYWKERNKIVFTQEHTVVDSATATTTLEKGRDKLIAALSAL